MLQFGITAAGHHVYFFAVEPVDPVWVILRLGVVEIVFDLA
jgi:hypothetical protein